MKSYTIETKSERETLRTAEKLALLLQPGDLLALEGTLGVGKTVFAKGLAQGLGVQEQITSPTFTIIKEYEGELPFYHMDAYRLEHSEEDIGFDEYFYGKGICVIEWAQFIDSYLPDNYLKVTIEYVDENIRQIIFHAFGDRYQQVIKELARM